MPLTLETPTSPPAEGETDTQSQTVVSQDPPGSFDVSRGQVVLDAALASGVEMAHGCRVGACGACAVEVVQGLESCDSPDTIERDTIGRYHLPPGVRLACRLTCRGPLRLKPA